LRDSQERRDLGPFVRGSESQTKEKQGYQQKQLAEGNLGDKGQRFKRLVNEGRQSSEANPREGFQGEVVEQVQKRRKPSRGEKNPNRLIKATPWKGNQKKQTDSE